MSGRYWIASWDNEATNLDRRVRRPWEIGLVLRDPDGREIERTWVVADVDTRGAVQASLEIGGYYQRHPAVGGKLSPGAFYLTEREIAGAIMAELGPAIVAGERVFWLGAVPDFDESDVYRLLDRWGHINAGGEAPWHYHLIDIETYVAGVLGMPPPWNFDRILAELKLYFTADDRHTALGDARMNMRAWDRARTLILARKGGQR